MSHLRIFCSKDDPESDFVFVENDELKSSLESVPHEGTSTIKTSDKAYTTPVDTANLEEEGIIDFMEYN